MKLIFQKLSFILIVLLLFNCKKEKLPTEITEENPQKTVFKEVQNLSDFKDTEFLPTLENNLDSSKNAIYGASFLFTWDLIRKEINLPLSIDSQFSQLKLLNESTSYIGVLNPDEYSQEISIQGSTIRAKTIFTKSLSFLAHLSEFHNKLKFKDDKVESFGAEYFYGDISRIIQIGYYDNNNHFVVILNPTDENHQIILYMPNTSYSTLGKMANDVQNLIELGKKERNKSPKWKYSLSHNDDDVVCIPKLNFNLETQYENLMGNTFMAEKLPFQIIEAKQRIAFHLDHTGAIIEDESVMAVDAAAEGATEEIPEPQNLVFDKPFYVLLKKKENEFPYFVAYVENTELMMKEK